MSAALDLEEQRQEYVQQIIDYAKQADFVEIISLYETLENDHDWTDSCKHDLGLVDRYYLLTNLLNRKDAYHHWLFERCREVEANPDGHLDLWARGHYKSTIITFAGAIQEVLRKPEITIAIFSHTSGIAKAFLGQIQQELENNDELKQIYSDVLWENPKREAPIWSLDRGLILKRKNNPKEPTLSAWGLVDGQPISKHFELRIYDDVVTKESVNTPEQIIKTTESWELSLDLGQPGGVSREWYIGTRYNFADTWGVMIERDVAVTRIHPATKDGTFDGELVFLQPEEWEDKKRKSSEYTIACQQLLNPVAGSQQEFKPEWIHYYEVRPLTLNVYIMVDYAGSRKGTGSSNTAMSVIGVDAHLNKYLLDGVCHKMNLTDRWKYLKKLRGKWVSQPGVQIVKVGYERYGCQSDIEHFETMMKIEGQHFEIHEINWPREGNHAKDERIKRLIPDHQNWRFFYPQPEGAETKMQREARGAGQGYLVAKNIKQINQENRVYDVFDNYRRNEYQFFPNTTLKDFLDSLSRIYDMEVLAPMIIRDDDVYPDEEPEF